MRTQQLCGLALIGHRVAPELGLGLKRGCFRALLKKGPGNCGLKRTDEKEEGAQQENVPWSYILCSWFNLNRIS